MSDFQIQGDLTLDTTQATNEVTSLSKTLEKLSPKNKNTTAPLEKSFARLKSALKDVGDANKDVFTTPKEFKRYKEAVHELENAQKALYRQVTGLTPDKFKGTAKYSSLLKGIDKDLKEVTDGISEYEEKFKHLLGSLNNGKSYKDIVKSIKTGDGSFKKDIEKQLLNSNNRISEIGNARNSKEKRAEKQALEAQIPILQELIKYYDYAERGAKELSVAFDGKKYSGYAEVANLFERLKKADLDDVVVDVRQLNDLMELLGVSIKKTSDNFSGMEKDSEKMTKMNKEIQQMQMNFEHFFSIQNGFYLLKRGINEAFTAVKELDASLTEIAVVSDYSLDDLWSDRDGFIKDANKLGATILDTVDARKLYIQQGYDMAESTEAGNETIRMARIANISGADATVLMTSALRGFKMEVEDTVRVNDVYSELAAKTAADTQQIATAMSKTASIASSAGASFENTSAFLTQIIETTQEAPETAGTALKTIIARFQSLKKPMGEIGEIDGEIVDANKVESALRQADVSLRNSAGEFRNFDDVILELAGKWDSLDTMTKRYIATTAAGSRQQSRFLALMEDNGRLMELVGMANNSAGASAKQFNKTLDSMEASLNKLSNVLHEFYTNLFNNSIIKFGIDGLSIVIDLFNNSVGAISKSDNAIISFTGSLVNLGVAIGVFKAATKGTGYLFKELAAGAQGKKVFEGLFFKSDAFEYPVDGEKSLTGMKGFKAKAMNGVSGLGFGKGAAKLGGNLLGMLGPIGKVTLALTALTAVIGFFDWLIVTPAEKIEKLQEQAEASAAEVKRLKGELESLGETRTQLDSLQSSFENLTKGSTEWTQALIDNNQQVLELIENNKNLAQYATTDANGIMSISEEGWTTHQTSIENNLKAMQIASLNANMGIAKAETDIAKQALVRQTGSYDEAVSTINPEDGVQTKALKMALAQKEMDENHAMTANSVAMANLMDGVNENNVNAMAKALADNKNTSLDKEQQEALDDYVASIDPDAENADILEDNFKIGLLAQGASEAFLEEFNKLNEIEQQIVNSGGKGLSIDELQAFNESDREIDFKALGIDGDEITKIQDDAQGYVNKLYDGLNVIYGTPYGQDYSEMSIAGHESRASLMKSLNGFGLDRNLIDGIIEQSKLKDSDLETMLSMLAGTDLTNLADIERTIDAIRDLGINIENDLLDEIIDLGISTRAINFETLEQSMKEFDATLKSIEPDTFAEPIDDALYQQILKIDPTQDSEFSRNIDGTWTYIGDNLAELIGALQANTNAIYGDTLKKEQRRINSAYSTKNVRTDSDWANVTEINNTAQAKEFMNVLGSGFDFYGATGYSRDFLMQEGNGLDLTTIINELFNTGTDSYIENAEARLSSTRMQTREVSESPIEIAGSYASSNNHEKEDITGIILKQAQGKIDNKESVDDKERLAVIEEIEKKEDAIQDLRKKGEKRTDDEETKLDTLQKETAELIHWDNALVNIETRQEEINEAIADNDYEKMVELSEEVLGIKIDPKAFKDGTKEADLFAKAIRGDQAAFSELIDTAIASTTSVADAIEIASLDINAFMDTVDTEMRDVFGKEWKVNVSIAEAIAHLKAVISAQKAITGNIRGSSAGMSDEAVAAYDRLNDLNKALAELESVKTTSVQASSPGVPDAPGRDPSTGSGGSSSETPWIADYDWLYNLVESINDETRIRNQLEHDFTKILQKQGIQLDDMLDNRKAQLASLKEEQKLVAEEHKKRLIEAQRIEDQNKSLHKYAIYDNNTGSVRIDWDAIESVSNKTGNTELGEAIDDYIDELENVSSEIDDAEDALRDIENQIYELEQEGRSDIESLEDALITAIEYQRQLEIDKLTELNENINNANSNMLDKLQVNLEDYRSDREENETLTDIQEMENRLALMQSDTSGANALDILALEEELFNARQDHTDSLIDKSIEEMTRQNERAFEQRQAQIDLMVAQLEWDRETGVLAKQANEMLTEAMRTENPNKIIELLKAEGTFDGMGLATQAQWEQSLYEQIEKGFSYWLGSNSLTGDTTNSDALRKQMSGKTITFTDNTGKVLKGTAQSDGRVKVGNKYYSGVTQGMNGSWFQSGTGSAENATPPKPPKPPTTSNKDKPITVGSKINAKGATIYTNSYGGGAGRQYYGNDPIYNVIGENNGYLLTRHHKLSSGYTGWFKKNDVKAYKTGGLVDTTGLAWLDGTKTKPEVVLDAKDSQNFIALRDFLRNGNFDGQSNNTYNYDIALYIDQIGSDYDVDSMINAIERKITDASAYRNTNAVSLGRR